MKSLIESLNKELRTIPDLDGFEFQEALMKGYINVKIIDNDNVLNSAEIKAIITVFLNEINFNETLYIGVVDFYGRLVELFFHQPNLEP